MDKSPVTPCPDAEVLAAWLDHGLDDRERAGVTAHVAECDDCRTIVANVLEFQDAAPDASGGQGGNGHADGPQPLLSTSQPARPNARRKIVWAGGVLAAAAAAIIAVNLQPGTIDRWRAEQRLADLAQAAGGQRTVEARLTGGFEYGPLRAPVRSGGSTAAKDNWSLLAAAGKIREQADKSPVAENLHGLGVAALVLGEHDEAIRALEDATSEEPGSGRYQSDLAAAYLARAQAADRPDDLTRGLTAAERALKADHTLLEARFNRALALERLYLTDQARKAWQDYLEYDPGSPWSDEARQHLQAIPEVHADDDQAKNNSPPEVGETTVEAALDWLLQSSLPAWASAVLASDLPRATALHSQAETYANAISAWSEDPFAADVVAAMKPSPTVANAIETMGAALEATALDDVQDAERQLSGACSQLPNPLATFCAVQLADLRNVRGDRTNAFAAADGALAIARSGGYSYLEGRALQLRGYAFLMSGDPPSALQPYRESYAALERGHYLAHLGTAATQLADLLDYTGLADEAWHWRLEGLRAGARTGSRRVQYQARVSAADLLAGRGQYEASRAFAEAMASPDAGELTPPMRVSRELQLAKSSIALGDLQAARSAAEAARAVLANSTDYRAQRKRSDLWVQLGEIAVAQRQYDAAEAALTKAIDSMGREREPQRASALLTRATVRARRAEHRPAEADVSEALSLLAERIAKRPWQAVRLDDAPAAFRAVGALVASDPALQGSRGLHLAERLRELLDGVPEELRFNTIERLAAGVSRLNASTAVAYYLFGPDDDLFVWSLFSGGRVAFTRIDSSSEQISRLVNTLTVQIARTPDRESSLRVTLGELYTRLIAPLPGITDAKELVVIPDGVLNRVPFGALYSPTTGQFQFEQRSVRVAPNLVFATGVASSPSRSGPAGSILVVGEPQLVGSPGRGFPRLPSARAEAEAVGQLYSNATILTGNRAKKADVLANLQSRDVLHFAGHALLSQASGQATRLLLAGPVADASTGLGATDLATLRNKVPSRVVLAACETGAASVDRAVGVVSLATVFLRAGTASVAGTLWPVDDTRSEEFFLALHRGLISGQDMAQAVAGAQRACHSSQSCRTAAATWVGTTAFGSS